MLLFKKKFLELIASGAKRQTVRVWPKRRLRPGQREFVPGLGRVRITGFDRVDPLALTEADARLDGFDSREALLAELRDLYGERLAAVPCFRISFSYPADATEASASDAPGPGDEPAGAAPAES
ncbi:MAG: ASCH domain-containing protein [Acidobacteria bacterium]|nr:ASCH domain-containing protein [Acidobacteriota bacterium]